ncbi:MAG: phenylalanine--tRNA ligase subunit beta [Deltaproteobacteria bacterium]|nr:phenylalanine--tRNA ligase subunit beta [Candidatus Anaeroferrophillus wilburensis]MBN2889715.1 phenylalanine--tRNA ligase subunit beta [Deltaproteobacteria bacterium]
MNVSWRWIGDFVDLTGIAPAEAAERLTMSGLEVAGVMPTVNPDLSSVVTAQITGMEKHPQADKLSLCTVFDGSESFSIICGATNMKAGDHVAMAPVGTRLPGGITIKKAKIRGISSSGMLCSAAELALEEESAGIIILPESAPLGIPLFHYLELDDHILEVEITPNRGDCLSVIGVAREIAALFNRQFSYPTPTYAESNEKNADLVSISIQDPDLCPRYVGRVAKNIVLADSPLWMKQRLQAAGVRSINNVVDITNYVMLETGQPLHAFDLESLTDQTIIVRKAAQDKTFVTLDEIERPLDQDTLMICDGRGPVAVAGIMGGLNSEITDRTRNILIESAYFQPASIRRSSRLLGLSTESSYRFERGVDPLGTERAADRAIELLAQLAKAEIVAERLDIHPLPHQPTAITIRTDYTNRLLGTELTAETVRTILSGLNFTIVEATDTSQTVLPPSYRFDIDREADLIEEVARVYGYHKIPTTLPVIREQGGSGFNDDRLPVTLKSLARSFGYDEAINYSFMNPKALERLAIPADDYRRQLVYLRNPLTEEMSAMRTTLLPALLTNLADNYRVQTRDIRLFELGKTYIARAGEKLPREDLCLAGVASGKRYPQHFNTTAENIDFFDLKGMIEEISSTCGRHFSFSAKGSEPYHHPGRSAAIMLEDQLIGSFGQLHPDVAVHFAGNQEIFVFELLLSPLIAATDFCPTFQPIPRYPAAERDLAVLVDRSISATEMMETISAINRLIVKVAVFDLYEGDNIPVGKKSIAFRITFQDMNKTLTDNKLNAIIDKIGRRLKQDFSGQIR